MPPADHTPVYSTALGRAYCGDAREILRSLPADSVQLALTSPPFPLRRKKAYGNVGADGYGDWFMPFAEEIHRVLRDDGSFVFELAPAWQRGSGTRSLYQYELVLRLSERFHLVQEFYWYNPSKLPSPAEYVTIRRNRVKDAVNTIWWFSKTRSPSADNRRVLRPYSRSMHRLFREGVKPTTRPSQHVISGRFERDNGGAIPPNLLEVANTTSQDEYLDDCRAAGLPVHPARFPPAVPEFFIRFLTEPGQLVLDPFGGSNVTGRVAEDLGRSWVSIEIDPQYVAGSRARFASADLVVA